MHLGRAVHLREYAKYRERFPDRVEEVTRLRAASGLRASGRATTTSCRASATRASPRLGADYLHSYFFYDRSPIVTA
jgi:hypothetical protein